MANESEQWLDRSKEDLSDEISIAEVVVEALNALKALVPEVKVSDAKED